MSLLGSKLLRILQQGRFKELMGIAGNQWLSHSGAISRALDILPSVALTLDCISELPDFDAIDRSIAAGLFPKMICLVRIKILVYLDLYLTNSFTYQSRALQ